MSKAKKNNVIRKVLQKLGKEISPGLGLFIIGNPRESGYPSVEDIKQDVLPQFQKKLLESARRNFQ